MNVNIAHIGDMLADAGYDLQSTTMGDTHAVVFEDDTVVGLALAFDTPASLLAQWKSLADRFAVDRQFQLRASGDKAWNVYLVLLAEQVADVAETSALARIEENLEGMRKIARAGIADASDVRSALLSLLPFQSAPILEPVDLRAEIRSRTTELPPRVVDAFLSSADPAVVLQALEDAQ